MELAWQARPDGYHQSFERRRVEQFVLQAGRAPVGCDQSRLACHERTMNSSYILISSFLSQQCCLDVDQQLAFAR